jgi:hypothetical protein
VAEVVTMPVGRAKATKPSEVREASDTQLVEVEVWHRNAEFSLR